MTLPCYHYADSYHYSQTSSVKMSKNGIFSRRCCCQGLTIKNFYADLFSSSNVSICSSASRNFTLIVMRLSSCTRMLSINSISMGRVSLSMFLCFLTSFEFLLFCLKRLPHIISLLRFLTGIELLYYFIIFHSQFYHRLQIG